MLIDKKLSEPSQAVMSDRELSQILVQHSFFLTGRPGGVRAGLKFRNLTALNLEHCDLSQADLSGAKLFSAVMTESKLSAASLFGADLRIANLHKADLSRADLRGACLRGAILTETTMVETDLRDGRLMRRSKNGGDMEPVVHLDPDAVPTELTCAIARGANMSKARASGAFIMQTDLTDAVLRGARFANANLTNAVLTGCDMRDMDLSSANLTGAQLQGAILSGSALNGATLQNAVPDRRDCRPRAISSVPTCRAPSWPVRPRTRVSIWQTGSRAARGLGRFRVQARAARADLSKPRPESAPISPRPTWRRLCSDAPCCAGRRSVGRRR